MSIGDIFFKHLSERQFRALSKRFYKLKKKIYKPFTKEELTLLLKAKGIQEGDTLFVHSSIDKLDMDFPVKDLLHLLEEVVGEDGTLLFPAWSYNGRTEDYIKKADVVFDVKRSPALLGLLPELARRKRGAHRSFHPTASVVALGKNAEDIICDHQKSIYPCDKNSPYYKMLKYNAKIIGLGEKTVSMSFLHCVEDVMGKDFPVELYYSDAHAIKVVDRHKTPSVVNVFVHKSRHYGNIPNFIKQYVPESICCDFKKKGTNFFYADALPLFSCLEKRAKDGITIYE